jgi:hypothetical protein
MASVEEYLASLTCTDVAVLQELATTDRSAFAEQLKAAGFVKMGHRLSLEAKLKDLKTSGSSAVPAEPPAKLSSEPPAEQPAVLAQLPAAAIPTAKLPRPTPPPASHPADGSFEASAGFEGARKDHVLKMGTNGLGYCRDAQCHSPKENKLARRHLGNLSWLGDEADVGAEDDEKAVPGTALAEAPARTLAPPGKLSEERRQKLRLQAGPFDPPLRDGKYAEKGQVVKILCGNARGQWGVVVGIKMSMYRVHRFDGSPTDASMFHEVMTTDLTVDRFLKAKKEWDVRAPLAKRSLQDDAKGQVHSSWTPNLGTTHLRLTDRSVVLSSRAKPGSGEGYYYAAVTSDQHTLPVAMPQKIDPSQVNREAPAPACDSCTDSRSVASKSAYYYAHRRKIDFHVPTPPPQKIG